MKKCHLFRGYTLLYLRMYPKNAPMPKMVRIGPAPIVCSLENKISLVCRGVDPPSNVFPPFSYQIIRQRQLDFLFYGQSGIILSWLVGKIILLIFWVGTSKNVNIDLKM